MHLGPGTTPIVIFDGRSPIAIKRFLTWLAKNKGYKTRIDLLDVEYLNPSMRERRASQASAGKTFPSLEDVLKAFRMMPAASMRDKCNRAMFALVALTGMRDGALVSLKVKHFIPSLKRVHQDPRSVDTKFGKEIFSFCFLALLSHLRGHSAAETVNRSL